MWQGRGGTASTSADAQAPDGDCTPARAPCRAVQLVAPPFAPACSTRAKQQTETGRIVNHMSADVNQLMTFFYPFAAQLVTGPAMLIAAVVLLWFQIRWATFIGLGILLATTPVTSIFMKARGGGAGRGGEGMMCC